MAKSKVSATLDAGHLTQARQLLGTDDVSVVLDTALIALIERQLERNWLSAHPDHDLPVDVPVDPSEAPWDDE